MAATTAPTASRSLAIPILATLVTLLGVGLSVEHFFDTDHYNPGFDQYPLVIALHVAPGGVYLALALLQFVLVGRSIDLHRNFGRVAVVAGLTAGLMALAVTALFPYSGQMMLLFVAPFAVWFLAALVLGWRAIRDGDVEQHRAWMVRGFAVASAIATQRLFFVPALFVFGTDAETIKWASIASFTASFLLHMAVAEVFLGRRYDRDQRT